VSVARFNASARAVPASGGRFDFTVSWDLSEVLAANGAASYVDPATGQTRYQVFIGYSFSDDQRPNYAQADMTSDGIFSKTFSCVLAGARNVFMYYVDASGQIFSADPVHVAGLAGLDAHFQRLTIDFPDVPAASNVGLEFSYRRVGETTWTPLPAEDIKDASVDLLDLAEGNYEYRAELVAGGFTLGPAQGTSRLREPATIGGLVDALDPSAPVVTYTQQDDLLSFTGLFPAAAGDNVALSVTDGAGVTTSYTLTGASFDTSALADGDY